MAMCFLLFAISPFSGGKGDDWWRLHILHLEKIGLDMLTQRMSFLLLFALLIADSVSTKDLVLAIFSPPSWVVIASGMVQDVTGTVNHNLTHEPSEQRSIGKQSEVKTHTTERKRGTEMAQSNSRDLYHSHAEVPCFSGPLIVWKARCLQFTTRLAMVVVWWSSWDTCETSPPHLDSTLAIGSRLERLTDPDLPICTFSDGWLPAVSPALAAWRLCHWPTESRFKIPAPALSTCFHRLGPVALCEKILHPQPPLVGIGLIPH